MKCKIAVVQFHIEKHQPEKNLKRIENFVKDAAQKSANIIVFPEDVVTGPLAGKIEFADSEYKYRDFFQGLARKYSICIVPGSIIEKENTGLYNSTYFIDAKGEIKTQYKKINLWHPEKSDINPGHKISVVDTEFGKIGLAICSDLMYPEMIRRLVKAEADIVICPSFWTYEDAGIGQEYDKNSDVHFINAMCVSRAFENEAIVVYCGAGGKIQYADDYHENLIGRSQIAVPFMGAIKKLDHNEEEMFVQEIDTEIVKHAQSVYKIREDLRTRILQ